MISGIDVQDNATMQKLVKDLGEGNLRHGPGPSLSVVFMVRWVKSLGTVVLVDDDDHHDYDYCIIAMKIIIVLRLHPH